MRIGAHISSAGGPQRVFERAAEIGAEAIQMFISAPQQWKSPTLSDEQVTAFCEAHADASLPVFFHGVYLINLGSEDPALLSRSAESLTQYVKWAWKLGVVGTIFHVGSHLGAGFETVLPQVCRLMREIIDAASNRSLLIMENNAGQGAGIGSRFGELGAIIRGLDGDRRVAVCLDTCHAFAMGYDIATREGCELAMEEFDREIGLDRLVAVHANDSKVPLGGVRDRHENIGEGYIGLEGFRTILSHPAFAQLPFFLEVPGFEGHGPDRENIDRLKRIREEVGAPGPGQASPSR
jgi:deoxyribonuclease-4